ncbi:MiaB family protein [Thermosulfurimonas dismutans]|uniref:tRNA (N(6)-L-threonylcarbamoyladenosine(37)-C(2))-methylthiotransferase n=2 Tax=Thermosulfurimonas dismutans TaxID=999894 RepID=A0A179D5X5_9BACT|nr:MiaB family protein [Thermosulfurimonas dismutans]
MKLSGRRIAVITLGCKVNQVEGAFLRETLEAQGGILVSFRERADLYVLNTCAVTAKAAYEGRKLLRRALEASPELVVVTGCYAQTFPEEILKAGKGPVTVLGHAEKFRLVEILLAETPSTLAGEILVSLVEELKKAASAPIKSFPGHSRAFLRIQDGCSARCAYCIVPLARGPARSLPEEEILKQAKAFVEAGYREIVVTGIHLGAWGRDLSPPQSLTSLLRKLESLGDFRLRLSSLEVTEITDELLSWARESEKFCPHFHVPLQSGSNQVLAAMGRNYSGELYLETLRKIRQSFPEAALGADVLVGFPGETEEDFSRTYKLIAESPLTYLHVFPYSPRPGTRAYGRPLVPSEEVSRRTKLLRELAVRKKRTFFQAQLGRILEVLVEGIDEETRLLKGLSQNYVPVLFEGPEDLKGKIVRVKVVGVKGFQIYGERL